MRSVGDASGSCALLLVNKSLGTGHLDSKALLLSDCSSCAAFYGAGAGIFEVTVCVNRFGPKEFNCVQVEEI